MRDQLRCAGSYQTLVRGRQRSGASGLALGVAIWSRGNAFIYVGMPIAGLGVVGLNRFIFLRERPSPALLNSFWTMALVCLAMTAIYFFLMFHAIYDYYFEVASSTVFDSKKIEGSKWLASEYAGSRHCRSMGGTLTRFPCIITQSL